MSTLRRLVSITPRTVSGLTSKYIQTTTNIFQPVLRNANRPSYRSFSMFRSLRQEEKKEQQPEQEAEKTEKPNTEAEKAKPSDNLAALQKQVEEANKKLKDYENKYLSALAESQNVRRIAKTDVDNSKKYGISKFAEQLLEVVDNLGRALTVIKEDDVARLVSVVENSNAEESTKSSARLLKTALEGVRMTDKVLLKTLEKNHVTKITDITGNEFDPKVHDAIAKIPMPNKPHNSVLEVVKEGFMIHDRVLRPAQVVVVVNE